MEAGTAKLCGGLFPSLSRSYRISVEYLGLSVVSPAADILVPFSHVRATSLCLSLDNFKSSIVDFNLNTVGWTSLWRLYHVWRGQSHLVVQKLHQDYGPVIRIGPNLLDLDTPT